ncbi:esterase [Salmonella enterica subsp. enterica]|uniref:Esterase n=1 Tax=Salmonella enterica I TaxID=59201 RepID=A0A3S5DMQ0_SALET|nr:esterase [Salmonella enterica subsp. enterica]
MEMLEEHRCFGGWQQRWRHPCRHAKLRHDIQHFSSADSG